MWNQRLRPSIRAVGSPARSEPHLGDPSKRMSRGSGRRYALWAVPLGRSPCEPRAAAPLLSIRARHVGTPSKRKSRGSGRRYAQWTVSHVGTTRKRKRAGPSDAAEQTRDREPRYGTGRAAGWRRGQAPVGLREPHRGVGFTASQAASPFQESL
eukprot:tig00000144_g9035.t1